MVTDRILKQLDEGVVPWRKPWIACGGARSHSTGKAYSFLNQILAGRPGEYATYKQIKEENGVVRKGEKSTCVVFWKLLPIQDEECDDRVKVIPYLHYYNVFHLDQTDGVAARFPEPELEAGFDPVEEAERVWRGYCDREGIRIQTDELTPVAYYSHNDDVVNVPALRQFENAAEYYSTLFHELTHSTGAASRLNRPRSKTRRFNAERRTEEYAVEELVAEIGSAVLCNRFGLISESSFQNNVAYIDSWRKRISRDRELIVLAAGRAEKAVNFILGVNEDESSFEKETAADEAILVD